MSYHNNHATRIGHIALSHFIMLFLWHYTKFRNVFILIMSRIHIAVISRHTATGPKAVNEEKINELTNPLLFR